MLSRPREAFGPQLPEVPDSWVGPQSIGILLQGNKGVIVLVIDEPKSRDCQVPRIARFERWAPDRLIGAGGFRHVERQDEEETGRDSRRMRNP